MMKMVTPGRMVTIVALLICVSAVDTQAKAKFSLEDIVSRYYTNEEIVEFMEHFTSSFKCSAISRKFSIGSSLQKRPLMVLEISNSPGANDDKPHFKYIANMHGDETSGRQLLLGLARWLCDNYGQGDVATKMVDNMHLFLMPTMNPDGFAYEGGPLRNNLNGRDLNRNFPDRIRHGDSLPLSGFEEPETLAVMDWTLRGNFVASANLHGGALVANYPWDAHEDGLPGDAASPDDKTFVHLAKVYANRHYNLSQSKEFPGGITNGNAWYPIYGGMQDWNYVAAGCFEITLELHEEKNPAPSQLKVLWDHNFKALLSYALEGALGGLSVTISVDEESQAIPESVAIAAKGNGLDVSWTAPLGKHHRPLAPGEYVLRFSAPEFEEAERKVHVPNGIGEGGHVNITLISRLQSKGLPLPVG